MLGTYVQGCCGCGGSVGRVHGDGCPCAAWCWLSCDAWVLVGRGVVVVVVALEGWLVVLVLHGGGRVVMYITYIRAGVLRLWW